MILNYSKFSHPKITNEIKNSVQNQLIEDISIYDNGGIYERLENEFKKKFNVENAIAVNSGTTALFSMFYGAGITQGDEVIVPSYTFFATKHRRIYERAVLVGHFNKRAKKEVNNESLKDFAITGTGLNLRMHPLGAAIVMPQIAHFEQMMKEKRETAALMKQGIESIEGLKVVRIPDKANPAWYALPVIFDETKFTVGLHDFVKKLNELGAVEADIPGSTCPINNYFLFHSPHKISQNYGERVRIEENYFKNAIQFHNSMFKLDVWYGEERYNFIENYLNIIKTVAELYKK